MSREVHVQFCERAGVRFPCATHLCMWISEQRDRPATEPEKHDFFERWFTEQCSKIHNAADQSLTVRGWEVFDKAVELGGSFAPNDYPKFLCNSMSALRPWVKNLEDVQLVKSWKDDKDQRRKSIVVTPRGRLAAYHRKLHGQPKQIEPHSSGTDLRK